MKTYPKMNETVKDLLRRSNEPMSLYILARLEELENQVQELTPPNSPLTLEELREMDGEPVFCVSAARPEDTAWGIVCIRGMNPYVKTMKGGCSTFFYLTSYSSAWLAYRRKPEE